MRIRILSDDEIEVLYRRPHFTHEERAEYFALSVPEKAALAQWRFSNAKMLFVLQLGYFKARKMFFVFEPREVEEDIRFLREHYFPDSPRSVLDTKNSDTKNSDISKVTRLKQQRLILALSNYQSWNAKEQENLAARARQVAMVCSKPGYVFRELMHYLAEQHVVAPGYSAMQDTVGGALAYEQRRLAGIAYEHIDPSAKQALNTDSYV